VKIKSLNGKNELLQECPGPFVSNQPIASLSLDLDNKWSYLKTHGELCWESFPSYLDVLVPRVLKFLQERKLTITVFIVGQDAALEKNREALEAIAAAGHEIGNHSFHHNPWLHLYSEEEIETELANAEERIERATGQRPIGFRGPGYSLSEATLRVLVRRGYLYDASTFPSLIGPMARAYYFMTARFSPEDIRQRKMLFGTLRDGLRPIKPYQWRVENGALIEVPVTTMPLFKVPIHLSYVMYLSSFSPAMAMGYFQTAIKLCQLTGTQPSVLLHPLDFLGYDDEPRLSFFPGMKLLSERKLEMMDEALHSLSAQYEVVTMHRHARAATEMANLPVVEPNFRRALSLLVGRA
jgi:hypothetical protein